ncbi:helix-turn-helix domain-containing protein [Bradyrhizobium genosp. L]|uniref:AraC-like ligand-binding domain-containing protein n=1 Tax=Bradyrhizobium genosp. L TaxID=83637 RepID=UPI0018A26B6E|nr:helix-turn-helix domain-containing protein [Bradyrhizobium genosp. L]QPF83805.1 helix-turn-helix domain-containing protein [Bradyrhizobium genosp. L]
MKKLFSTSSVRPYERFDLWHAVACQTIVRHSSTPESRRTFEAEIETGTFGDIGLVSFATSPMAVSRTAQHIAQAETDDLFICRQTAGNLALEQDDRRAVLGTGDMTLLDPLRPYTARFSSGSKLLVAKIHRRGLEARVGEARRLLAIALTPEQPEHRWTSSLLAMLPTIAGRQGKTSEGIAQTQFMDLVASSLLNAEKPDRSSARSLARLNLRAAIENRLSDPNLDAAGVAAAAGMGLRYANALLSEDGTSVMRLALAMRLERCRRALEDRQQDHRTISDIARRWGFADMTHFGRSFRSAFGVVPREYRRMAKTDS